MTRSTSSAFSSKSAPHDGQRNFKQEKEHDFKESEIVDLTADSPQHCKERPAFAADSKSPHMTFLRRHHRTSRVGRPPMLSNGINSYNVPIEADTSILDAKPKGSAESHRALRKASGEVEINGKAVVLDNEADAVSNGARENQSSSGASFSGRADNSRQLMKAKSKISVSVGPQGGLGETSLSAGGDCQVTGQSSSAETIQPLSWKRKRSMVSDATRSRQKFRPVQEPLCAYRASESVLGQMRATIEVDHVDCPSSSGGQAEHELTARQIEEDEMLAKILQEEYSTEADGGGPHMDDAQLARMLQEEEDARQRTQSISQALNASAVQAARRELRRVLPIVRSPGARPVASSSRMRILRNLHNNSRQHISRGNRLGGRAINADERLFNFPEGFDLDSRVELLAALETVSQERFSGLPQVDRDFNEGDYEMLLALDDTNHVRNGASYDRIQQLPISVIKPTDVYEEMCSICLDTPVVEDVVRRLPCLHGFHMQCIDPWLEQQGTCPVCKMEL